jgi:hypothetical protein
VKNSGGLGSKGLCDIPYKKIQKALKISPKGLFSHFVWVIEKATTTKSHGHYGQSISGEDKKSEKHL